jgi:hypothetical protein
MIGQGKPGVKVREERVKFQLAIIDSHLIWDVN